MAHKFYNKKFCCISFSFANHMPSLYFPEAVFKEKLGVWDPMLELAIISPYLIVDSYVQLPKLFKNGTTKRKWESTY
jgi:hypothetical protein